jgi:hypothetical protein
VSHPRAPPATLNIGLIADLVQLLNGPRRIGYQAEREPPSDDRRRHIAYSSRSANRGDHLRWTHYTNASGSPFALAPSHPALESHHPCPALQLVVVHRQTGGAKTANRQC